MAVTAHLDFTQIMKNNNTEDVSGCIMNDDFESKNPFAWTPLHYAVAVQNYELVKNILEIKKEFLSKKDKYGRTSLSIAAAIGNLEITKLLLESEVDTNNGLPVCYSTSKGNRDCALEVIEHGGNVNEEDLYDNEKKYTPLTIAVIKHKLDIIDLLLDQNADVNKTATSNMTPLHIACQLGNFNCVKLLSTREVDWDRQDDFYNTPLDYALLSEQLDVVRYLLEKGSSVDKRINCRTPLHYAVLLTNEYVKEIIKYGADIDAQDSEGATPLYLASYKEEIDENVIQLLLDNNADPSIAASNSWTPLHMCCITGNLSCLQMLLQKVSTKDVNAVTSENITPLYLAAANGHLEVCRVLLKKGAFVNIKINGLCDFWSPLPYLVNPEDIREDYDAIEITKEKGYVNLTEMLIDYQEANAERIGAIECLKEKNVEDLKNYLSNINDTDLAGWTCLHHAVQAEDYNFVDECTKSDANVNTTDKYGRTPITIASKKGNLSILKLLLANEGDPNLGLPLFYAIDKNKEDIVKYLLESGADINQRGKKQQTPLIYAVSKNKVALVHELIERNADISLADEDENTAIHIASLYGFNDCIKILLRSNANINVQNKLKDTPITLAAAAEESDIIKALLENGADVNIVNTYKESALHIACYYNSVECVKEILQYMPNLNEMNADELTPLFLSLENLDIFKLLVENGADTSLSVSGGWTLLHAAAFYGHLETCCELLNLNVDIDALTSECITPLYLAASRGHLNIVAKLVDQGCLIDVPINNLSNDWKEDRPFLRKVPTTGGTTPLLAAVMNGHLHIVQYLQKCGASVYTITEDNMNALSIAILNNRTTIIDYFAELELKIDNSMKENLLKLCKDNAEMINQVEILCQ